MAEDRPSDPDRCSDIFSLAHLSNPGPIIFAKVHIQEFSSELVERIICFVREELPNLERVPLVKRLRLPRLQITQIHAKCRAIALNVADSWDLEVFEDEYSPALRNLISSWLHKISGLRLSLKLYCVGGGRESLLEGFIIPNCQRFKNPSVPLSRSELEELLCPPEHSFSNLETLRVLLIGDQPLNVRVALSPFITTPFLRELVLIVRLGIPLEDPFPMGATHDSICVEQIYRRCRLSFHIMQYGFPP